MPTVLVSANTVLVSANTVLVIANTVLTSANTVLASANNPGQYQHALTNASMVLLPFDTKVRVTNANTVIAKECHCCHYAQEHGRVGYNCCIYTASYHSCI
ncbi:hypothetical protein OTU49_002313 [Cherax quadricarinatus]|uniref:Uncharacterized protein n=1 Tax=Cherax quadricarinatus TaxID=27406 RepID=A0AAW0XNY1_CHEQU